MTDETAERAMHPLFERGREALRAYVSALPNEARPLGGPGAVDSIRVVCLDDFVAHARLCVRNVVANGVLTHVLCEEGHLCAILERRIVRRW